MKAYPIIALIIVIVLSIYYKSGRHLRDLIKPEKNIIERWLEKIHDLEYYSWWGRLLSLIIHLLIFVILVVIIVGGGCYIASKLANHGLLKF